MAYDDSYYNEQDAQEQKKHEDAKKTAKVAAKAAGTYFGGEAGGKAVDLISKTKVGDKALDKLAKPIEKNKMLSKTAGVLNDTGLADKADQAISLSNGGGNGGVPGAGGSGIPSPKGDSIPNVGGEKNVSLPSSSGGSSFSESSFSTKKSSVLDDNGDDEKKNKDGLFSGSFVQNGVKVALFVGAPFFGLLFIILIIITLVTSIIGDFTDAFAINQVIGDDTGNVYVDMSDPDQAEFYNKVYDLKLEYQAKGKTVDPMKVVSVYHVLKYNGAEIDYGDMSEHEIKKLINYMFDGNSYSEDAFRNNLIDKVIPDYLPETSDTERESIADQVLDYIDNYYNIIGKDTGLNGYCTSTGSCSYDIKGFYIGGGAGNVAKNMQISNLKVRLMECGGQYGTGNYNKAIDQPLVDFEDYVAGVAYAEIGADSPAEAVKAQLIAARSFALARPTEMGNALGKKLEEENGQWVLQIASCVSDQVFCNINEGCSYMGGGDGQGGIVRSGKVAGAWRTRDALPQDHPLRTYMKETEGEVLVNDQGYIIETGFDSSDQYSFIDLAKKGLNYKQILLQFYNSGRRPYHASDIQKASCGAGGSNCVSGAASTGEFATWKQYEGPWINVAMGGATIRNVGCLITSISIQIAKSGVPTVLGADYNPGTFVQYLNSQKAFSGGGGLNDFSSPSKVAPTFQYQGLVSLAGKSREEKLNTIRNLLNDNAYPVCEVKGGHGQHWVAIDTVQGDDIVMMDPGSGSTNLWEQYPWSWTSKCIYYKVVG